MGKFNTTIRLTESYNKRLKALAYILDVSQSVVLEKSLDVLTASLPKPQRDLLDSMTANTPPEKPATPGNPAKRGK